jgi:hypothetical protein
MSRKMHDKCDNCGSTKSETFWDFEDGTVLCSKCHKKYGNKWQRKIDIQKFKSSFFKILKISGIVIFGLIFVYYLYYFVYGGYGIDGFNKGGYDRQGYDINGFDKNGYDRSGYNSEGYNKQGYDKAGFNKYGYNREGYDKNGFDRQGYDIDGYDSEGYNINGLNRDGLSKNPDEIEIVKHILEEYHKDHTYTLKDLFVCSDMAIDVWNLVETKGINAQICAGNVDENIFYDMDWDYVLGKMNHAWVLAEISPFAWLALETTGGYVVLSEGSSDGTEEENDLYYSSKICFPNPKEFKEFLTLKDGYFDVCSKSEYLADWWNKEVAGNSYSNMDEVYQEQGKIKSLIEECNSIKTDLYHLVLN